MTQRDASHHDGEAAEDSVQAMAMAGYAKFLAEGSGADFDHETSNCMYDMAVAGRRPFENLETYLALYPAKDRDAVRRMILSVRELQKNRRTYTVQPGDTVMVARDRELPHEDPDSLSEFIPCRIEDAVPAIVVEHDGWWLSFRMPDGTTERVLALSFKNTGRCSTGGLRAHPQHEEFRKQGIHADFAAPETRVFHPDVFREILHKKGAQGIPGKS